jgi:arylsulfatase A-like enzyme
MKSNILFILIDSFRADYFYEHKKSFSTPNIDRLIKKGVYCKQSISCADGTAVAMGGIFTGLYSVNSGISTYKLKSKKPNYFNHLQKLGYNIFTTLPHYAGVDVALSAYFKQTSNNFQSNFERLDKGYGEDIVRRLDNNNLKEPWFHFLYLGDLHMSNVTRTMEIPKRFDSKEFGENKFERSISLVDYWLGKFLEKIDLESTLLIITADHGDYVPMSEKRDQDYIPEFTKTVNVTKKVLPKFLWPAAKRFARKTRTKIQEKRFDEATKNLTELEKRNLRTRAGWYLYDDLVRTPLLFCGSNISEGKLIKNQVGNVDIFPTILDLIGVSQMDEDIDGESFFPLIKDESGRSNPIYLETASVIKDEMLGKMVGIRTPEFKYFRSRESPKERVHLYNLQNDPLEENNLAEINQDMVNNMEQILSNFLVKLNENASEELSPEEANIVESELKRLGYM